MLREDNLVLTARVPEWLSVSHVLSQPVMGISHEPETILPCTAAVTLPSRERLGTAAA